MVTNFKYAIWFLPNHSNWDKYTSGPKAHMTIKSGLSLDNALCLFNSIEPTIIPIRLANHEISHENGFWAMYYCLKPFVKILPNWWPTNPHISFIYQYDKPILFDQISNLPSFSKIGILNKIALVDCNGHFSNWKILKIK